MREFKIDQMDSIGDPFRGFSLFCPFPRLNASRINLLRLRAKKQDGFKVTSLPHSGQIRKRRLDIFSSVGGQAAAGAG